MTRDRAVLFVAALAAAVAGCRARSGAGLDEVRIASLPYLSFAPLFLAEQEGDFRREGIVLRWTKLESNSQATAALASGRLDASAGIPTIGDLRAIERGAQIRMVADKGHEESGGCGFTGLLVRPGFPARGGLPRPDDLRGARVRSNPGSLEEFLFDRFLSREGVPPSAVRTVTLPAPAIGAAFAHGAIDLAMLADPERTRVLRSGQGRLWMAATDFEPGFQLAYVEFGPRLLGPARALGVRFLKAYLRGVARYREGKTPRNVEILARRTGLDPGLIRACCWIPVRADGEIDPATLDAFQEWAVAGDVLRSPLPLSRLWDPGPLRDARRALGGS